MPLRSSILTLALAAGVGLLSGCDSAEERAEKHFQSGMELLQAGDVDRALVEFRNVFKLNNSHAEARVAYAKVERERGNLQQSYSQYLRLVEQYPENLDGRRALAEMAADALNWAEVDRHAGAALEIAPEDPGLKALDLGVRYSKAVIARNASQRDELATTAREMLKALPDSLVLHRVSIDNYMQKQDLKGALTQVEAALAHAPQDRNLLGIRLSILNQFGDQEAVEEQLREMVDLFPDDPSMRATLVRWLVSRGQTDKAEEYVRSGIAPGSEDPAPLLELVNFLVQLRGADVAIAEMDEIIAGGKHTGLFRSVRAGLIFDLGRRDEAIAEMQDVLADAEVSDETRNGKVTLARMLVATGNSVRARALVEEVLAEDAGHVDALKLKAGWLVDDDNPGEAISTLRRALDESPKDPELMTLMARAHERDGNRELVGEMLALAVDASNRAPGESLQYAQYLISNNKLTTAEEVMIDALRLSPNNPDLLGPLGELYLKMEDWGRASQIATTLEGLSRPETTSRATALRAAILRGQQKTSETIGYLEDLIASGEAGIAARIEIIRTYLDNGDAEAARAYASELLAENPDDPSLRFVEANVRDLTGETEAARKVYRDLVQQDPERLPVWLALFRQASASGDLTEAAAIIENARAALPDSGELKWAEAGLREKQGDIDGAIAIYEDLYDDDTNNVLVANNLASLISEYRKDSESTQRAFTYARRLRGTEFPPYQDTYGWIMHQRGDSAEALRYIEPAAAALETDPLVQYHMAEVLRSLDREADALEYFRKVLELTRPEDERAFVTSAREAVAGIQGPSEGN